MNHTTSFKAFLTVLGFATGLVMAGTLKVWEHPLGLALSWGAGIMIVITILFIISLFVNSRRPRQ